MGWWAAPTHSVTFVDFIVVIPHPTSIGPSISGARRRRKKRRKRLRVKQDVFSSSAYDSR